MNRADEAFDGYEGAGGRRRSRGGAFDSVAPHTLPVSGEGSPRSAASRLVSPTDGGWEFSFQISCY